MNKRGREGERERAGEGEGIASSPGSFPLLGKEPGDEARGRDKEGGGREREGEGGRGREGQRDEVREMEREEGRWAGN